MNKEQFLKALEKKLAVLSKEEKKDILDEYRDIIDEKIKHGKTENEAVNEFGNLDSLAKEILSAYKIDPEYNKPKSEVKEFVDDCEKLIKKGAKKLSEVTEEVTNNIKTGNSEMSLENIFEIVIKVLLALVLFAVLRLPFMLVSGIGEHIFNFNSFWFSGHAISFIWKLLVEFIYILTCVFIVITFVNQYVGKNQKKTSKIKEEKGLKKEENKVTNAQEKNLKKEEKKTEKKITSIPEKTNEEPTVKKKETIKNNRSVSDLLITLLKICIIVLFLLPLWFICIALFIGLGVVLYLAYKGIFSIGVLFLLIGLIILFVHLASILFKALFHPTIIRISPFIVSIIMITFGFVMTIDYFASFTVYDGLPKEYEKETKKATYTITEPVTITFLNQKFVDNTLPKDTILLEIEYYDRFIDLEPVYIHNENQISIDFDIHYKRWNNIYMKNKHYMKMVFDDLKHKTIYNYRLVDDIKVNVYASAETLKRIVS